MMKWGNYYQNQYQSVQDNLFYNKEAILHMTTRIKQFGSLVASRIQENPKTVTAAVIVAALSIWAYSIRRKEHHKLYKINQVHSKNIKPGLKQQQIRNSDKEQKQANGTIDLHKYGIRKYEQETIYTAQGKVLQGWMVRANIKQRNPQRLIIYFHSQHSRIEDNLDFVKILSEYTISDVLIFQYSNHPTHRTEKTMKEDAIAAYERGMEIAGREDKSLILMGKDLGAMLAIHICSMEKYRFTYRLKALIIEGIFGSLSRHKTRNMSPNFAKSALMFIYDTILTDKWQIQDKIMKIRVPTMLLLDRNKQYEEHIELYSLYQGRKIVYEITTNDKFRSQRARKKRGNEQSEDMGENEEQQVRMLDEDKDRQQLSDGREWAQDITNYFMEIDIFMNNLY